VTGGQTGLVVWPATGGAEPPRGHRYGAAVWLLGRHEQLADLAARIPGVITVDDDGPDVDLDALADAVCGYDTHTAACDQYQRRHDPPAGDHAYARWQAAGPQATPAVQAVAAMSGSEQARLRLLATFAAVRVGLQVGDFGSFDGEGSRLLADWCQAVQAQ
jgi:hypothetical protein